MKRMVFSQHYSKGTKKPSTVVSDGRKGKCRLGIHTRGREVRKSVVLEKWKRYWTPNTFELTFLLVILQTHANMLTEQL